MGKSSHTGTGACWDSRCVRPAGREHSDSQQEERESHHPPRLSQKQLDTLSEEPGDLSPRRKDTPYQHQPPFVPGVKILKNQTDPSSLFQEEEENRGERKDSQSNTA